MRYKTWKVVSNKMAKTIVIEVDTKITHPKYRKKFTSSKKFYAHVENPEEYNIWDIVTVVETLPMSKLKRWVIAEDKEKQLKI